ncbi:MAG: hypothetical protein QCI38_01340 [Candidatus Thermoplasmatota archaeon]|nr:hypothetical protein [Candidatus Thermoplasmatota archaeon]
MKQASLGREDMEEDVGISLVKAFFRSFLSISSDFMGLASNSMLYRAGETVGKEFAHLSIEELVKAFEEMGFHLVVQESGGMWNFVVDGSVETEICGGGYEPCCHMLRGFFSSYIRTRSRNPYLRCTETECSSMGNEFCRFVVSP